MLITLELMKLRDGDFTIVGSTIAVVEELDEARVGTELQVIAPLGTAINAASLVVAPYLGKVLAVSTLIDSILTP